MDLNELTRQLSETTTALQTTAAERDSARDELQAANMKLAAITTERDQAKRDKEAATARTEAPAKAITNLIGRLGLPGHIAAELKTLDAADALEAILRRAGTITATFPAERRSPEDKARRAAHPRAYL